MYTQEQKDVIESIFGGNYTPEQAALVAAEMGWSVETARPLTVAAVLPAVTDLLGVLAELEVAGQELAASLDAVPVSEAAPAAEAANAVVAAGISESTDKIASAAAKIAALQAKGRQVQNLVGFGLSDGDKIAAYKNGVTTTNNALYALQSLCSALLKGRTLPAAVTPPAKDVSSAYAGGGYKYEIRRNGGSVSGDSWQELFKAARQAWPYAGSFGNSRVNMREYLLEDKFPLAVKRALDGAHLYADGVHIYTFLAPQK